MTRRWFDGPMCAFDTETTGIDPGEARIVTAAVVMVGPASALGEQRQVRTINWLINPGIPIPAEATAIHGITDAMVIDDGKPARTAVLEIAKVLEVARTQGAPIVGYNAVYDLSLLDHELARYGHPPLGIGHVVDPLVIDRAVDPYRKGSRKLVDVAAHYGIPLGDQAHGAEADAHATARLAWTICSRTPGLRDLTLEQLHDQQAGWQKGWAEHYQQYLRTKKGQPDAVIDSSWPIRRAPRDVQAAVA